MFMASRRRRIIITLVPGVGAALLGLMAFFAMRDDELETAGTWRTIFWIALLVTLASVVTSFFVPERTKKRQRLDAMPAVESQLAGWFHERRRQGNVSVPYNLAVVASPDDLYISVDISTAVLKVMQEAHAESRLIPMIEGRFFKPVSKVMAKGKMAIRDVHAVRATPSELVVSTIGQEFSYRLTNEIDHEAVAASLASLTLRGVLPERSIATQEVGMLRKKDVAVSAVSYRR